MNCETNTVGERKQLATVEAIHAQQNGTTDLNQTGIQRELENSIGLRRKRLMRNCEKEITEQNLVSVLVY